METAAREAWRTMLEGWAIPQRLIDAVGVDSQRWQPEFWERLRQTDEARAVNTATFTIVEDLSRGGSVLDLGAGSGRLAMLLAGRGHRVTAVERDPEVARSIAADADRAGVKVTLLVGGWPVVAGNTGIHDVVLCTQVVYEVPSIGGFVEAMHDRARRGVVVEMTPRHPWTPLSRYFRALHGLDRPSRPTVDDFLEVVREVTGREPRLEHWSAPTGLRFADLQELLAFYRRRLLIPPQRSMEAAALLQPDIRRSDDGSLVLGALDRDVVTVWWKK